MANTADAGILRFKLEKFNADICTFVWKISYNKVNI